MGLRATAFAITIILVLCSMLSAAGGVTKKQPAPAIPMFLNNPERVGNSSAAPSLPLTLNWKHTIAGEDEQQAKVLIASPIATEDTVYFFVGKKMYALSAQTGASKWKNPLNLSSEVNSTPIIVDDKAIFGGRNGHLYFVALKDKKGEQITEFRTRSQHPGFKKMLAALREQAQLEGSGTEAAVQSSPLYQDGKVFFGATDGWVYALDVQSQKVLWDYRTTGPIVASPAYVDGGVYVASMDGSVYGFLAKDGQLIWKTNLCSKNLLASPVVTHSKVIQAAGRYMYTMDRGQPGYVRGRFEAMDNIVASPVVCGRTLVFGDTKGQVYAVDVGFSGNITYTEEPTETRYFKWKLTRDSPQEFAKTDNGLSGGGPEGFAGQGKKFSPEKQKDGGEILGAGFFQGVRSSPIAARIDETVTGRAGPTPADNGDAEPDAVIIRSGPRQLYAVSIEDGTILWHYTLSELAGTVERDIEQEEEDSEQQQQRASAGSGRGAAGMMGGLRGRRGQQQGRTTGMYARVVEVEKKLDFNEQLAASPFVADGTVYVIGGDRTLYAFDAKAADAVAPQIVQGHIQVPAEGDERHQEEIDIYHTADALSADDDDDGTKVPGTEPIYVRLKTWDEGCGIDPSTLTIKKVKAPADAPWELEYDAEGPYVWAICDKFLKNGEYAFKVTVADWRENAGEAVFGFTVDNEMPTPKPSRPQRGRGGGMEGGPGGMPGGMPTSPGAGMSEGMYGPGMVPGGGQGGGPQMPGMPGGQ